MRSSILQYILALGSVAIATLISWFLFRAETYWVPSILYLFLITILGGFLGRGPTILAAALSAIAWDYLFIPPRFTLHVGRWEDALILLTYAAIGAVTSLYTTRLRQSHAMAEASDREAAVARASEELYRIVFNSISHEMRSPLTTIMGASSALYLIGEGEIVKAEDRRVLLREMIRSAIRLSRLVDNFLNASRLESNRMQLRKEKIDVRSLIHDVLHSLKEELSGHEIEIALGDKPIIVDADTGLLSQAFFCIAHNVAQYTPAGTKLKISSGRADTENIQIIFEDNGPGIGSTPVEKLFEKFYRAEGKTPGGVGLGLGIARGIIELHGGTLVAEKIESGGLRFIFTMRAE